MNGKRVSPLRDEIGSCDGCLRGLTLVEAIVAIAVLSLLMALILPAIQAARESARLASCRSNLRQIGIAAGTYESTWGTFPLDYPQPMFRALLPYVEARQFYDEIQAYYDAPMGTGVKPTTRSPDVYRCPSSRDSLHSYGVNSGAGVNSGDEYLELIPNGFCCVPVRQALRASDISDGLSNTAAFSEVLQGIDPNESNKHEDPKRFSWGVSPQFSRPSSLAAVIQRCTEVPLQSELRGRIVAFGPPYGFERYLHFMPPNARSCHEIIEEGWYTNFITTATSKHAGLVNVAFADSHVRDIANTINLDVWHAVGTRNGNEKVEF